MKWRETYSVRISGLREGRHTFSFKLDDKFFAAFDHPDFQSGNVSAEVILEKTPGVMTLHFRLKGKVLVTCDRCLEPFYTGILVHEQLFVKTVGEASDPEDNVIVVDQDEHEIDISQFLFEFTTLALPLKKVHPRDAEGRSACDPEMIEKLKEHQATKRSSRKESDPRWNALKDIIEKNK